MQYFVSCSVLTIALLGLSIDNQSNLRALLSRHYMWYCNTLFGMTTGFGFCHGEVVIVASRGSLEGMVQKPDYTARVVWLPLSLTKTGSSNKPSITALFSCLMDMCILPWYLPSFSFKGAPKCYINAFIASKLSGSFNFSHVSLLLHFGLYISILCLNLAVIRSTNSVL